MDYRIETLRTKTLAGLRMEMSFADNRTFELWNRFMPMRKAIEKPLSVDLFSVQIYPENFFDDFNPDTAFEKWAAAEISGLTEIPEGMEAFELPSGLYAVFIYKGRPADAAAAFKFILGQWMSDSGYSVDNRPHFEVLGDKYKHDHAESPEEIWIPIKPKTAQIRQRPKSMDKK